MKGITGWGYRPYRPAYKQQEAYLPFVVRIAPHEDWFEAEWLDNGKPDAAHCVRWRPMGTEVRFHEKVLSDNTFRVDGLTI